MKDLSLSNNSCGHCFCFTCWKSYLQLKIEESGTHHILCPATDCNILVDMEFIERTVSPEIARKYLQFDIEAFVERNKTIKWCPFPGCGRAVKYPGAERELQTLSHSFSAVRKISHSVDCGNGHFFCWECLREPHTPCDCEQWSRWLTRVSELNQSQLNWSSSEAEDAANNLWLLTNAKPCPNCKSPIQRTEGCNHMKCSKCKYVFCWVCLESWKKHSSNTGGYFQCNRYSTQETSVSPVVNSLFMENSGKNHELKELSKFIICYSQYRKHENLLKEEEIRFRSANVKTSALAKYISSRDLEIKEDFVAFLEESLKELVKSRRIVCGSHAYSFFLQENNYNKALFELLLREIEGKVGNLSGLVSRDYLITPRSKIINTTLAVRKARRDYIRAINQGNLLPLDLQSGSGRYKRTLPNLYGLVTPDMTFDWIENGLNASNFWATDNNSVVKIPHILNLSEYGNEILQDNNVSQSLAMTLLKKCNYRTCTKPKARNAQTGVVYGYCSFHYAQLMQQVPGSSVASNSGGHVGAWSGYDYSSDLLIALEMSRLQMIEDVARRRKSWLEKQSRQHLRSAANFTGSNFSHHTIPRGVSATGRNNLSNQPFNLFGDTTNGRSEDKKPLSSNSGNIETQNSGAPSCSNKDPYSSSEKRNGSTNCLSSVSKNQEMLRSKAKEIFNGNNTSIRKSRFIPNQVIKSGANLLNCNQEPPMLIEDGRFKYDDFHESNQFLSVLGLLDYRRSLKRSQSVGDLTDRSSSDLEWMLDSDHSHHQDFPEAPNKLRLSCLMADQESTSQEIELISPNGVENKVKPSVLSDKLPNESSFGNCSKTFQRKSTSPKLIPVPFKSTLPTLASKENTEIGKSSGVLMGKEGDSKQQQNSNGISSSSSKPIQDNQHLVKTDDRRMKKMKDVPENSKETTALCIQINSSDKNKLEADSSYECESETGIPKSPTLYISGVSISRSPEPVSPKSLSKDMPSNITSNSDIPMKKRRSRSSSMIVRKSRVSKDDATKPSFFSSIPRKSRKYSSSSLTLKLKCPSSNTSEDLRVSRSASEPDKGRLVFHFPKSPTEGTLSSVLHVRESTLSSEDFHEALFLSKSPKQSKKKKSKP